MADYISRPEGPTPPQMSSHNLDNTPTEELFRELSALDSGLQELLDRRSSIRLEINRRREQFAAMVMKSDEFFYNVTRANDVDMPTEAPMESGPEHRRY